MRTSVPLRPLAALLLLAPAVAQEVSPTAVNQAIDRGVAWLLAQQEFDGSWKYGQRGERIGLDALVVYTLLESGLDPEHHALQRALAHLEGEWPDQTYDTALLIMALAEHDGEAHADRIEELVAQLLDWRNSGGWGYPQGVGDLSNTQYAALGLWAAAKVGAEIPLRTWDRLSGATLRYHTSDGGFGYRPDLDVPTGSMTAAGVGVLAICRGQIAGGRRTRSAKTERALERGLVWLAENFTVQENPGRGSAHLGYYLYGLERVGALAEVTHIGDHDWYREGAAHLVRGQSRKGNWGPILGGGHPQTCFALLFLRRATAPKTGGPTAQVSRRYFQRSEVASVRIAAAGDAPLSVWLEGFSSRVRDELEWPGERGQGPRVARVVWLIDGVEAGRVEGDQERPAGYERFEVQHRFELPGEHELQAEVHLLRPPQAGLGARATRGTLKILISEPLTVTIENACPEWMLANARDTARNLLPRAGPQVRASSSLGGAGAELAVDADQGTFWMAEAEDPRPTLTIELASPVGADVVVVGHARRTPHDPGRWARALEVEVVVNGESHRLRMHSDERRKARLELPSREKVRTLELRIPRRVPGRGGSRLVGLAEVELQDTRTTGARR